MDTDKSGFLDTDNIYEAFHLLDIPIQKNEVGREREKEGRCVCVCVRACLCVCGREREKERKEKRERERETEQGYLLGRRDASSSVYEAFHLLGIPIQKNEVLFFLFITLELSDTKVYEI